MVPSYPQIRLRDDSASYLAPGGAGLEAISRNGPKLARADVLMAAEPVPVTATYFLEPGFRERTAIVDLPARDAVVQLITHTRAQTLIHTNTPGLLADHLRQCSEVVRAVPPRVLQRRRSFEALGDVMDAVEADSGVRPLAPGSATCPPRPMSRPALTRETVRAFAERARETLSLLWKAAPLWTSLWLALLAVQGVLPAALVTLTKWVIDSMNAAIGSGRSWETVQVVAVPVALMGGVFLLQRVLGGLVQWVSVAQSEYVGDYITNLIQEKASTVDYEFYEASEYHDLMEAGAEPGDDPGPPAYPERRVAPPRRASRSSPSASSSSGTGSGFRSRSSSARSPSSPSSCGTTASSTSGGRRRRPAAAWRSTTGRS